MGNLSRGKYAYMISDRSGQRFPYTEMVQEWNFITDKFLYRLFSIDSIVYFK